MPVLGSIGHQEQDRLVANTRSNPLDGGPALGIDPMQILDQHDQWLLLRLQGEQDRRSIPGPSGAIGSRKHDPFPIFDREIEHEQEGRYHARVSASFLKADSKLSGRRIGRLADPDAKQVAEQLLQNNETGVAISLQCSTLEHSDSVVLLTGQELARKTRLA